MRFDILTIFPGLLESPLQEGIIRRALAAEQVRIEIHNIRDYALDKHAMTDDRPFGGGEGMVMKPEPLAAAVADVRRQAPGGRVILLSPQGRPYNQAVAEELAQLDHLVLVCGRYEGVDERFIAKYVDEEISIGDYILTGGELAAMVMVDSITRLLPGVLGCADSADFDTFSRGGLKYPQYTRPRVFEDMAAPEVLFSGDHGAVAVWRLLAEIEQTMTKRPELVPRMRFSAGELKILKKQGLLAKLREAGWQDLPAEH
ncbi:MAG: tRNA (guanosine(37)-N1)-methyltransferase TrmD [Desulfobulbaceae bacterium]|nr:tRNA (guanosine(37)-N1)-methyltransferase TrmD [Desulfobulbaceae bacterium]HIJ78238.1 tRNA (guanosine(37)-N1)-methyltransferase TrmD [Deltaproteobacteria bacterium]